jgi:O-antigen ligase
VTDRPPLEYVSFALGASCIPALAVIAARASRIALPSDATLFVLTASTSLLSAAAILFSVLQGTAVGDVNSGRLGIDILNPVTVGEISGMSVALGVRMLLIPTNTSRQRLLIALASLASGIALISTGARGPLIATVTSLLILVFAHPMSRVRRVRVFASAALLSGAVALFTPSLSSKFGLSVAERFAVLVSRGQEESVTGRLDRLWTAISDFGRHPILGSSITTSTTRDYPHNVIAEAFMATGLLGGGLFLAIVFASVRAARRRVQAPEGEAAVWPATIFPNVMLTALVSGSIAYSSVLWVTIASLILLGSDRPLNSSVNYPREVRAGP